MLGKSIKGIQHEGGLTTQENLKNTKIIRDCYEQLYINELESLEKMDAFSHLAFQC